MLPVGGLELRSALFSGITSTECTSICATARAKEFTRGTMLYFEGDSVRQVLLLTSGVAKINKLGASGSEVILRLSVPGDVLGVGALFSTGGHGTAAQAFRQSRALAWEGATFKALAERHPLLLQNVARILCRDGLEMEERFREMATERVGPRVARQLLRLRDKIGRMIAGDIEIGLSRDELARMTGTTLFTVSRLLSAWETRGIVKPRRESVTLCKIQSLVAISEGDESGCCADESHSSSRAEVRPALKSACSYPGT